MRQRSHNSDLPLVPEDVSAGGFKVLVTSEPHLNKPTLCGGTEQKEAGIFVTI